MNYYKEGDKLLVLNKYDDTKHIVEVNDVDKGNDTCTYEFKCLYGSYGTFNFDWVSNDDIEIIKKVTDSDIDAFREENDIKFKIGDAVIADGETQNIELYDTDDSEYRLDDCVWYNEDELEAIEEELSYEEDKEVIKCSVGDKILVEYEGDKHILEVIDLSSYDSNYPYKVECLYGHFREFHNELIDIRKVTIIKKVTNKDINLFCKENEISKRIGDEVIYCNQKQTITAYDSNDEEYLLSDDDWVKDYQFEDKIDLSYSIGDIILINDSGDKHIVKIIDTDEVSDFPYKVECLYGEHGDFDSEWIKESDIAQSLDCSEINELLEEMGIDHKIGDTIFYDNEQVEVLCFDTYDGCYYVKNKSNGHERWADKDEVVAHLFKEGDLVKIKKFPDCIVRICNFCDDGDIEVECVVGDYGNIDTYYKSNDLETATQAEVDILQKDFLFKVGEKVLYGEDRTEDYIHNIDTNKDTDLPYYLGESWDYVSEKEIFKIDKIIKSEDFVKNTNESKETFEVKNGTACLTLEEVVEVKQEVRPRRRLLLG